jgi:hypothetical protein
MASAVTDQEGARSWAPGDKEGGDEGTKRAALIEIVSAALAR